MTNHGSSSRGGHRFEPEEVPVLPGYALLRRIGRGSYGDVWLARGGAGEFRAVKVVYRKTFEHDRPFERELSGIQKFEPVSRSHPSQVSILQVGSNQDAGYFYYVMELADDASREDSTKPEQETKESAYVASYVPKTLKDVLTRRGRLSFRECLEVSLALTTALDHLHQHGLIHRDIKPSNVIFVGGVPKLADIGLVTDAGESISYVGTEGFLPPEGPGSAQADVYSLGKVLYEISTGRDRMEFPELPTFIGEVAEREHLLELNQIFLRACQNDVRKRYPSARAMAADLELLRRGRSVREARAAGRRLAKLRVLATAAVLLAIAFALANHFLQQQRIRRAEREKNQKERDARIAREVATDKTRQLANVYAGNGNALAEAGDYFGALVWHANALLGEDDPSHADEHRNRLTSLADQSPTLSFLAVHPGGQVFASSLDGHRVLTAGNRTVQVWNVETSEPIGPPLRHIDVVRQAALSPDGHRVVTISDDGIARLWTRLAASPVAHPLEQAKPVHRVAFSPNGGMVLTVSTGELAVLRESSSGRTRFTLSYPGLITAISFSPDGRWVALAGADGGVQFWTVETGEPASRLDVGRSSVVAISFSPDSRRLATANGSDVRLWSTHSGEPSEVVLRHDGVVRRLCFTPDGRQLATAGDDSVLRIWDAITGRLVKSPSNHQQPIESVAFSPDGRYLACASGSEVQFWNTRTWEPLRPRLIHSGTVSTIVFNSAGHALLTASLDGVTRQFLMRWSRQESDRFRWDGKNAAAREWAQLLAGRKLSRDQQLAPIPAEELAQLWSLWKGTSPWSRGKFDLAKWHQAEAAACEASQDWFAARFHWERAAALNPNQVVLGERAERAAIELARVEANAHRNPDLPRRVPVRLETANPRLIDLSAFYNAALTEAWLPARGMPASNDLSALPSGVVKFNGVEFDARGILQLAGGALENAGGQFPRQVGGVPIHRPCRHLHFLHGAAWSSLFGTHVGSYVIHYTNGESREVKIIFGQNVREWWFAPTQPQMTAGAAVAWEGSNPASRALGMNVRLYQMKWINPLPDIAITTLEFKSTLENSAPFLISITAE